MRYFWLNQRESPGYSDVVGKVYHYQNTVPGHKKLSAGDRFVYYRPGNYVIFGGGVIGEIEPKPSDGADDSGGLIDYFAKIESYWPFEPSIDVADIKSEISFLRSREGLRGVPK